MVAAHRMAWATYIRPRAIASWKTMINRTVRKVFILLVVRISSAEAPAEEEEGSSHATNHERTNNLTECGRFHAPIIHHAVLCVNPFVLFFVNRHKCLSIKDLRIWPPALTKLLGLC